MIMASFVGNAPIAGLVQEVGYFDDDNGIILRANGTSDIIILTLQCSSSEDATGLIGWRDVV
jgi:hypothetical protein